MSSSDPFAAGSAAGALRGRTYFFAGLGGSGMSALAQYAAMGGARAAGSDRDFDAGRRGEIRARLEELGVEIHPQDGSGVTADCDALVVSTAVEETVPDVAAARQAGVPVIHRSELLARMVAERRTIAVTGTSGKSTVTAMIYTILEGAGLSPSLITGGALVELTDRGLLGNAVHGEGDLLVIEADESDGSLVRYEPWCGVVLNLQRDHKEPAEVARMFAVFRERTRGPFLAGEDPALDGVAGGAERFGLAPTDGGRSDLARGLRAREIELRADGSRFRIGDVVFELPRPGLHEVRNAVAAVAACRAVGVEVAGMAASLAGFRGVVRRFQVVGEARGTTVIDDFAHNPEKIAAALAAARERGGRVLAVFQPHGFGPTRFLRDDLIEVFAAGLRHRDRLWLPEIYYVGGTVTRDISSADLAAGVRERGGAAEFVAGRKDLPERIAAAARPGDTVLVMGARDPSLTGFCRDVLAAIEAAEPAGG